MRAIPLGAAVLIMGCVAGCGTVHAGQPSSAPISAAPRPSAPISADTTLAPATSTAAPDPLPRMTSEAMERAYVVSCGANWDDQPPPSGTCVQWRLVTGSGRMWRLSDALSHTKSALSHGRDFARPSRDDRPNFPPVPSGLLIEIDTGEVRRLPKPCCVVGLSEDARVIAMSGHVFMGLADDEIIAVGRGGELVSRAKVADELYAAGGALSPDGRTIAISEDSEIVMVEVASGRITGRVAPAVPAGGSPRVSGWLNASDVLVEFSPGPDDRRKDLHAVNAGSGAGRLVHAYEYYADLVGHVSRWDGY